MLELHRTTCDFILGFYSRITRYVSITASLLKHGHLDYDSALNKIRLELYGLHNQIYKLLLVLRARLTRFDSQIQLSLEVSVIWYTCQSFHVCCQVTRSY